MISYSTCPELLELIRKVVEEVEDLSYLKDRVDEIFPVWMDGGKHLNYFAKIRIISGAWTALCAYFNCEFKYMLIVNGEHFGALNEVGKKRVIEHELRHIPYDSEKKGLERHNVEDFKEMLRKYGLDYVHGVERG